jgi:hypothetical protein
MTTIIVNQEKMLVFPAVKVLTAKRLESHHCHPHFLRRGGRRRRHRHHRHLFRGYRMMRSGRYFYNQ